MSSRPPAQTAAPARPPTSIHATAIISDKAVLTGSHLISIGANTVIHPFAKLDSTFGEIKIGEECIVAERAVVGLASEGSEGEGTGVTIGDSVSIETSAVVEAESVGKGSVVCVMAVLGRRCKIGEFGKITATTIVEPGDEHGDFTVVMPDGAVRVDTTSQNRRDVRELKLKGHAMHIDTLRKLIPSNTAKWAT